MSFFCCTENRRGRVRGHDTLNGLDFLEIIDLQQQPDGTWVAALELHFLNELPNSLNSEDIVLSITGGERITQFNLVAPAIDAVDRRRFSVTVVPMGDFSIYALSVAEFGPLRLDPLLRSIDFTFTADCNTEFDCEKETLCPPAQATQPVIDYLAKDYASFRQLMLDRLSGLVPNWQERNAADLNMALVEILAYIGDYSSYQQDAISTEAYLHTAGSRVSIRRHARLVDYFMHNGNSARVWVQAVVNTDAVMVPAHTQLMTRVADADIQIPPNSKAYELALQSNPVIFETVHDAILFEAHNRMRFYTWGEEECCLPKGAVSATLHGHFPMLTAGSVLIFEEIRGGRTGDIADADRTHRHALRLTHVTLSNDPLDNIDITEIIWADEDALPTPFCVKDVTVVDDDDRLEPVTSIVLGNIILADHGATIKEEIEDKVPGPHIELTKHTSFCEEFEADYLPPRYRPSLRRYPLAQTVPYIEEERFRLSFDNAWQLSLDNHTLPESLDTALRIRGLAFNAASVQGSASLWSISDSEQYIRLRHKDGELHVISSNDSAYNLHDLSPSQAIPAIQLASETDGDPGKWFSRRDLLSSDARDPDFVVEIENDGRAALRFGDDHFGFRPRQNTRFTAKYRVGNGTQGNIGSDAIIHIVINDDAIDLVRNPLPAWGGNEPESIESVRQQAPFAFRQQERAVTPEDYAAFVTQHPSVQRAIATLRWTGSWHTIFLTVDPVGGRPVDEAFENKLRQFLERYRLAGHDLEIDSPHYVPLEIDMKICVKPDYFRADVKQSVLAQFTSGNMVDGSPGVFHPDNFTFGQTVYLSPIYAATQAVEGVASLEITRFHRQGLPDIQPMEDGKLSIDRLEIPRLDNNPNFPERGVFRLTMEGGK